MTEAHGIVVSIPHTFVTPDGSRAEMVLQYSNNKQQTVRFSPKTFFDLLSRTFQLVLNQHIQTATARGHVEMDPIPVSTTMAQETVGGEKIIVSVRMQNGLPASFSVEPKEAEELHKQLGIAIEKAKVQSASSRH